MSDRANQLISDILRRIREAIVENDVTYEEYQAAKQWLLEVGEAGEWPLFGDVYIEHVVEEHTFGNRSGSQGTILGPFHLPDAPVLEAPFELPHRADEPGDPTLITGRVTDVDGASRPTRTSTSGRPMPMGVMPGSCRDRRTATCVAR